MLPADLLDPRRCMVMAEVAADTEPAFRANDDFGSVSLHFHIAKDAKDSSVNPQPRSTMTTHSMPFLWPIRRNFPPSSASRKILVRYDSQGLVQYPERKVHDSLKCKLASVTG